MEEEIPTSIDADQNIPKNSIDECQSLFSHVITRSPFGICIVNVNDMTTYIVNDAFLEVSGKQRKQFESEKYWEIFAEVSAIFKPIFDTVVSSGVPYRSDEAKMTLIRKGVPELVYISFVYEPLFDASNKIHKVMISALDVTVRVHSRLLVEESEQNLKSTILQAPVAMAILRGSEYVVEIANDRMYELWGKSREALFAKPIFEGLPEAKGQGFEELLHNVMTTGESFSAQGVPLSVPRNEGLRTIYINFLYEPYREKDGLITGIIVVATDITQEFLAHQGIEIEVLKRTEELAKANEELKATNYELAQFTYIASHDLQEPLRKISTYSNILKSSAINWDPQSQAFLGKILKSSQRMNAMIRDVLKFSEIVQQSTEFKNTNLGTVLSEVLEDFELLIQQTEATIIKQNLPSIEVLPSQIAQLFTNLISNALKFSRKDVKTIITISSRKLNRTEIESLPVLKQSCDYHQITFSDNGIGFDSGHKEKIFNIFQRLHTVAEYEGTGIGLAICKKVLANHHGDISASSETGKGTSFYMTFPELHLPLN